MPDWIHEGAITIDGSEAVDMITLRGPLGDAGFATAVAGILGMKVPEQRRPTEAGPNRLVWMSPDEALAIVPHGMAGTYERRLGEALADRHALAVDVSDARVRFRLRGTGWREVLAKGAPVDLDPAAFGPGDARRTRLGQVACAFWCTGADAAEIVCFRSVAEFVFDWLRLASAPGTLPGFLRA